MIFKDELDRVGPVVDRLTHGVEQPLKELIYQLLDAGLF